MRVLIGLLLVFAVGTVGRNFSCALPVDVIAQQTAWPQFRANPQLTGVAPSTLAPTLKVMWTFDVKEAIESSAAIADGAVYVGIGRRAN